MTDGWHCLHLYYLIDQTGLDVLDDEDREVGRKQLAAILKAPMEDRRR